MNKLRIRQNYDNYERVKNAFKSFIHALVWESADICEGMDEKEVNSYIQRFCDSKGERVIAKCNGEFSTFLTEAYPRYNVTYNEYDDKLTLKNEEVYHVNNLSSAIEKATHLYCDTMSRYAQVDVFDNVERKYIVQLRK